MTTEHEPQGSSPSASDDAHPRVVVIPTGAPEPSSDDAPPPEEDVVGMVAQPAKVMRIGTMIKQLLDEVRSAPLDEAARVRLAEIHERSLTELEEGLSPELVEELHRITLPFVADEAPSDAELRIAQAQLVGWLEGLFHGIQTALVAQQMMSQAQLSQTRRALPPGSAPGMRLTSVPPGSAEAGGTTEGTGQYL
ncbi:bacterial proteasome activator family protein [Cellulomonas composti]|uniref:bacterial proteasome activator family protein n=1 Tax=Cellulomonas composti TaxID=266130 RepID=UPI0011BFB202